jgi:hypothetical protein
MGIQRKEVTTNGDLFLRRRSSRKASIVISAELTTIAPNL